MVGMTCVLYNSTIFQNMCTYLCTCVCTAEHVYLPWYLCVYCRIRVLTFVLVCVLQNKCTYLCTSLCTVEYVYLPLYLCTVEYVYLPLYLCVYCRICVLTFVLVYVLQNMCTCLCTADLCIYMYAPWCCVFLLQNICTYLKRSLGQGSSKFALDSMDKL